MAVLPLQHHGPSWSITAHQVRKNNIKISLFKLKTDHLLDWKLERDKFSLFKSFYKVSIVFEWRVLKTDRKWTEREYDRISVFSLAALIFSSFSLFPALFRTSSVFSRNFLLVLRSVTVDIDRLINFELVPVWKLDLYNYLGLLIT